MVILVFYVGYRIGLHFIYLFAVLIQTNTVVVFFFVLFFVFVLPESAYLSRGLTVIKQNRDPLVAILEMHS